MRQFVPEDALTDVYDTEHLAAAYAVDRPSVHAQILASAALREPAPQALDVGCGAGLSTAALMHYANRVTGLEPAPGMLVHREFVAPGATFVVGQAEHLPFASGSFDLVSAAGSLNYADVPAALAEVARVLVKGGTFLLYDFSTGRRTTIGGRLETWFAEFEQRFPRGSGSGWQPIDARKLPLAENDLSLQDYADVEVLLPMTFDAYVRYILSETNVSTAIDRGICSPEEARNWCSQTLRSVFAEGEVTVVIPAYIATIRG